MRIVKPLTFFGCLMAVLAVQPATASIENANKLAAELTPIGANPNANADGTIPAWNPNGPVAPEGFDPSNGVYPDPYASDEKLFSIDATNMAQYADQLPEGVKAMLERYSGSGFKLDIYPSHRDFVPAEWIVNNTKSNAEKASLVEDGLKIENSMPGYPFPVPNNGLEAMWNHLRRPIPSHEIDYHNYYVAGKGDPILASKAKAYVWMEAFEGENTQQISSDKPWMKLRLEYHAPARRAGEILLVHEPGGDYTESKGRKAWQYLTGQRRVRLAPSVNFDTPNPGVAGAATYDDGSIYNGSPEMYDWTLVGKKEMYIPYNNYELVFSIPVLDALGQQALKPEYVRWEKHRVWVVEADIKEGKRHIYHKRRFYLDEDTWAAVSSDAYDSRGQLWRVQLMHPTILWDLGLTYTLSYSGYDLLKGLYHLSGKPVPNGIVFEHSKNHKYFTSKGIARAGVR